MFFLPTILKADKMLLKNFYQNEFILFYLFFAKLSLILKY